MAVARVVVTTPWCKVARSWLASSSRVVTPAAVKSIKMPRGRLLVFLQALLALLLVQVHVHAHPIVHESATRDAMVAVGEWVDGRGSPVIMTGTNVVLKGAPWIPSVSGDAICDTTLETGNETR